MSPTGWTDPEVGAKRARLRAQRNRFGAMAIGGLLGGISLVLPARSRQYAALREAQLLLVELQAELKTTQAKIVTTQNEIRRTQDEIRQITESKR